MPQNARSKTAVSQINPAFYALRFYNRLFDQSVRCVDNEVDIQKPADSQSEVHCFEKRNGNLVVTAWLRSPRPNEVSDKTGLATDPRHETVTISFPQHSYANAIYHLANGVSAKLSAQLQSDTLRQIPLSGGTVFIAELVPSANSCIMNTKFACCSKDKCAPETHSEARLFCFVVTIHPQCIGHLSPSARSFGKRGVKVKSYVSIRRIERRCEVVHSRDVKTFIVRIRNTLYNGMELQPDASLSK